MADSISVPIDISQLEARPPAVGDSLLLISADKKSVARLNVVVNSDQEPSLVYVVQTTPNISTDGDKVPTVSALEAFLSAASGAVRFDQLQTTITDEQAAQARTNIKAIGAPEISAAIQQHNINPSAHADIVAGLATKSELAQKLNITDAADTYATVAALDAVKSTADSAVTQNQLTTAIGAHNMNAEAHASKFNTLESNLSAQISQKLSIEQASSTYATLTSLKNLQERVDALELRVSELETLQSSYPVLDAQGAITVKGITFYDDQLSSPQAFSIGISNENVLATRRASYVRGQAANVNGLGFFSATGTNGSQTVYGMLNARGITSYADGTIQGALRVENGIVNVKGTIQTPAGTPVQIGGISNASPTESTTRWIFFSNGTTVDADSAQLYCVRNIGIGSSVAAPMAMRLISMGTDMDMGSHKVVNMADGVEATDGASVGQLPSVS